MILYLQLTMRFLERIGAYIAPLGLRLILAWEFYESGLVKFHGDNWFANIQDDFLFPFNIIPTAVSWFLATWVELIGGLALLLGVATRFFAVSLLILTIVAAAAVHWPQDWQTISELAQGYAVRDLGFGNYKLPVLFAVMLLPLIFYGPGRISIDRIALLRLRKKGRADYRAELGSA